MTRVLFSGFPSHLRRFSLYVSISSQEFSLTRSQPLRVCFRPTMFLRAPTRSTQRVHFKAECRFEKQCIMQGISALRAADVSRSFCSLWVTSRELGKRSRQALSGTSCRVCLPAPLAADAFPRLVLRMGFLRFSEFEWLGILTRMGSRASCCGWGDSNARANRNCISTRFVRLCLPRPEFSQTSKREFVGSSTCSWPKSFPPPPSGGPFTSLAWGS